MLPKLSAIVLLLLTTFAAHIEAGEIKVIAHRGATGQLPENSLPSFVLAAAMKIDYISMELVMTSDYQLVVFHDIELTGATNVTEIFPGRSREDGKYYVIDFTLAELQQLSLTPEEDTYPADLRIPSFSDTLALFRQLEKVLGYTIGIAPEIKKPWFHLNEGKDISSATLDLLQHFHYSGTDGSVYLQCYDPEELQRIHKRLLTTRPLAFKLVQLIDSNDGNETQRLRRKKWAPYNFQWMFTRSGAKLLALYADAVTLDSTQLLTISEDSVLADFLNSMLAEDVRIHALSLGNTEEESSVNSGTLPGVLDRILSQVNIDIITTDSPAPTLAYLKARKESMEDKITDPIQLLYTPTPLKD